MDGKKVVVITGASRGIGRACAIGFAGLGYQTVLIARDKQKLEEVANEIQNSPEFKNSPEPLLWFFDIAEKEKINSVINAVVEKFGRIDVLVNNAGIYYRGTSSLPLEKFEQQLAINLTAAFSFVKAVIPVMKKQKHGYIFNIASRSGKVGFAESGGYSASKFGLVGLTGSLVRELSEYGISATAICPGWVDTEMAYDAGTPLKASEMIQPSDIFKTMEWLLGLSPAARVKEVMIESSKSIH